jgi:hypothetical protein
MVTAKTDEVLLCLNKEVCYPLMESLKEISNVSRTKNRRNYLVAIICCMY